MKKEKIFLIFGIIIITIGSCVSVFAANYLYNSNEVSYDNTSSGIQSDNVQGAIDELYESADIYKNLKTRITNLKNDFLDKTYPVGSIYISATDSTVESVQTRLGGTWEKIEGKFLLSASSSYAAGSTGGSADAVLVSHTHTFTGTAATSGGPNKNPTYKFTGTRTTTEGAGKHSHTVAIKMSGSEAKGYGLDNWYSGFGNRVIVNAASALSVSTEQANHSHYYTPSGSITITGNSDHTHSVTAKGTNSTVGVSGSGKNMPPYLSVYMYKRVG